MKCAQCGHTMKTARENYLYKESGLPNVTLVGIEVSRCTECGESEAVIPKIEQLHRALAMTTAQKVPRLTPEEIRFLRKYLGWSGADFADHIGVAAETVSRWENGSTRMSAAAERLLRLAALRLEPVSDYPLEIPQGSCPRKGSTAEARGPGREGKLEGRSRLSTIPSPSRGASKQESGAFYH